VICRAPPAIWSGRVFAPEKPKRLFLKTLRNRRELEMAKGQIRSNKEAKKPKKEKPKVLATAGLASATAPAGKKK
jgi:hypothetical protein